MAYGSGNRGGRQQYDNNLRGALFENQDRRNDNDPDMKGSCEIDGVEYWVSAWWKNSNKVGDYLSIALTEKEQRRGSQSAGNRGNAGNAGRGRPAPNANRPAANRGGGYGNQGSSRGNQDRGPDAGGFDEIDEDIPF